MIPRTFPSEFVTPNGKTQAIVYSLPSVSGLKAWIDYIPVKGVANSNTVVENTYAADGYMLVRNLDAISGMTPFKDYIPVYEDATATKPWSTDVGGYIPMYGLFSIQGLFAAGEQGVWYDPSDYTTLFQDSAGTTPVTAVEQPVGLMLDKSKGLVLGPELVTNGDFSNGTTGWTAFSGAASPTISVVSGELQVATNEAVPGGAYQTITTVSGRWYAVTASIRRGTAADVRMRAVTSTPLGTLLAESATITATTATSAVLIFQAASTSTAIYTRVNASAIGQTGYFDNISVKELPGNHAFQATSANRPVLSARVNLLRKTEAFDDAAWVKQGVTVISNATEAPDGTTTADTITASSANSYIYQGFSAAATTYTFSVWIKSVSAGTSLELNLFTNTGASSVGAAVVTTTGSWQRVSVTGTFASASASAWAAIGGNASFATGETIYVWGADMRPANVGVNLPAYQRVNTSTDYDTTGFPLYLKFNGTNSSLATNSINFTTTDKMTVWAGLRKLSDAAVAVLAELSVDPASNNGSWSALAPATVGATYRFGSKGSTAISLAVTSTSYAAPITNVFSGVGDIAGDTTTIRLNGTQAATNTADQGTGTYGNYPLYIGARAGNSLYFNGQLYSLIVRGATSTSAQITAAETWVNTKTGAY